HARHVRSLRRRAAAALRVRGRRHRRRRLRLGHAGRRHRARIGADVWCPDRAPGLPHRRARPFSARPFCPPPFARRHFSGGAPRRAEGAVMSEIRRVERWTGTARASMGVALVVLAVLALGPVLFGPGMVDRLTALFIYVVLAAMWNALAGYGGLVSVGQQVF